MAAWMYALFLAASLDPTIADRLYAAGDFEKAAVLYRDLLAQSPRDVGLLIRLGATEYQLQAFAPAEAFFRKAASLRPDSAQAQMGLGTSLLALERSRDAVPVLERALKLSPADRMARRALGHAYQKQNAFFAGEKLLSSLIAADPSDAESWSYLGALLYENNYYRRSLDALDHALQLEPANQTASIYRAGALAQLGRTTDAGALYQALTADRSAATRPELWLGYAQFLFEDQQLKPSLDALNRANTLLPNSSKLLYWRARVLMSMGETEAAEVDARRAVDLSPDLPNAHNLLMKIYQVRGLDSAYQQQARWLDAHTSAVKSKQR